MVQIIPMPYIGRVLFGLTAVFFLFIQTLPNKAEAASCVINLDGEINTTLGTDGSSCTVTPDEVSFPVYKFGLCATVPTYLNYLTACEFLYDSASGTTVPITTNSSFDLVEDVSITEGTYLAAVVMVGNTIKVKHTAVFASTRNGLEESGGSYQKTDGQYCVTRLDSGSEDDFASNLDCGDDTLVASVFSETNGAYDTSGIGGRCSIVSDEINSNISFTTESGETDVCGMLDTETLETYDSNGDTNATRQLVVQTFTNPVVVRASTKSMTIQFKVTDMLSVEANDKVVSGTSSLYTQAYLDGFEIKIDVN